MELEIQNCKNGHPMKEASRERIHETVEDVVYVKQRIKHFNREGSEFWAETEVPDLVEREVVIDRISLVCEQCDDVATVDAEVAESPETGA